MVDDEADAKRVYASLSNALNKFLRNVVLEYAGCIPFDRQLQRAVQKRSILLDGEERGPAATALEHVAAQLLKVDEKKRNSQGNLNFFMGRVFQAES